jgi:hypothetical protein
MNRQERIIRRLARKLKAFDEIQIEDVEVPFKTKDMSLFLGDKKIADFERDKTVEPNVSFIVKFVNPNNSDDYVIDYFYDVKEEDLKNEREHKITTTVDVSDVETYGDSSIDGSGREWSYLAVEGFKVHWGDIDITDLLDEKTDKRITEHVEELVNSDYKPKYLGTHRTY